MKNSSKSNDIVERLLSLKVAAALRRSEDPRTTDEGLKHIATVLDNVRTNLRPDNLRGLFVLAVIDNGKTEGEGTERMIGVDIFTALNGTPELFAAMAAHTMYQFQRADLEKEGDDCDCENCQRRREVLAGNDPRTNAMVEMLEMALGIKDGGPVDPDSLRDGRH